MGKADVVGADLLWSTLHDLNKVAWRQDDDGFGKLLDPSDAAADTFYSSSYPRPDGTPSVYGHVQAALMLALTRLTGDARRAAQIHEALCESGEDVGYHLAWLKREQWDREDALTRSGRDGVLITDALAKAIAAEYISPARVDADLTGFATGAEYDPYGMYTRLTTLITSDREFASSDALVELYALRDWVGERVPGIVIYTQEVPADDWADAVAHGDTGPSVFPPTRTVKHAADEVDGEWMYPGDPGYPADAAAEGFERDDRDGSVYVPESVSVTVARLINDLYVDWCSAEPFAPGAWYEVTTEHAHTGDVTTMSVHLTGLTPEQEAEVHALWMASMRPAQ